MEQPSRVSPVLENYYSFNFICRIYILYEILKYSFQKKYQHFQSWNTLLPEAQYTILSDFCDKLKLLKITRKSMYSCWSIFTLKITQPSRYTQISFFQRTSSKRFFFLPRFLFNKKRIHYLNRHRAIRKQRKTGSKRKMKNSQRSFRLNMLILFHFTFKAKELYFLVTNILLVWVTLQLPPFS